MNHGKENKGPQTKNSHADEKTNTDLPYRYWVSLGTYEYEESELRRTKHKNVPFAERWAKASRAVEALFLKEDIEPYDGGYSFMTHDLSKARRVLKSWVDCLWGNGCGVSDEHIITEPICPKCLVAYPFHGHNFCPKCRTALVPSREISIDEGVEP